MTKSLDPDLARLDELGILAVAQALNLSSEAVRKWRIRGAIPDNRRDELRRLVAINAVQSCRTTNQSVFLGCLIVTVLGIDKQSNRHIGSHYLVNIGGF